MMLKGEIGKVGKDTTKDDLFCFSCVAEIWNRLQSLAIVNIELLLLSAGFVFLLSWIVVIDNGCCHGKVRKKIESHIYVIAKGLCNCKVIY